jgi:hypothetical protein
MCNVVDLDGPGVAKNINAILGLPDLVVVRWIQGYGRNEVIVQWAVDEWSGGRDDGRVPSSNRNSIRDFRRSARRALPSAHAVYTAMAMGKHLGGGIFYRIGTCSLAARVSYGA